MDGGGLFHPPRQGGEVPEGHGWGDGRRCNFGLLRCEGAVKCLCIGLVVGIRWRGMERQWSGTGIGECISFDVYRRGQ